MGRRRSRCRFALSLLGLPLLAACDAGEPAKPADKPAVEAPASPDEAKKAEAPADAAKPEAAAAAAPADGNLHALTVTDISGKEHKLSEYEGKVMLVVNTASECGFTNQYTGLQKLHATYGDKGLVVLGFPSNDFGGQEPGTNAQIATFVKDSFGVEFPMFSKLATKGSGQAELYKYLTTQTREDLRGDIKWNFTKFLVDGKGNVVKRFESPVDPMDAEVTESVEALLADLS